MADVAPSILHIMGLEKPADMTGENLISDNK
ncbi:phosphoglyceromutase [Segatella copri]|nr:phosphoglyceromutase [Segatella copri]